VPVAFLILQLSGYENFLPGYGFEIVDIRFVDIELAARSIEGDIALERYM